MKKQIAIIWFSFALILTFIVGGCASTSVKRVEIDETVDLSGRWNDTDSKLTSEAMITQALSGKWLENFSKAK